MHDPIIHWTVAISLSVALAACSSGKPQAQTEEDLHAIGPDAAEVGHPHVFLCADDYQVLVDFGDDGLSLRIRQPAGKKPLVLTAPSQGASFRGGGLQATLRGQRLKIGMADGPVRTCVRQTKG